MKIDLSVVLPCSLDQAVANVMTTRLLLYVSRPIVAFTPVGTSHFPATWTPGTHWVRLKLFGVIPFGKQAVVISNPEVNSAFALRDAGYSALIPVWNHLITIDPVLGGVRYRDQVEIHAGLLTPLIWVFAQFFYQHRQRRWLRLAANGFNYSAA